MTDIVMIEPLPRPSKESLEELEAFAAICEEYRMNLIKYWWVPPEFFQTITNVSVRELSIK